jgi:hypothetical protein
LSKIWLVISLASLWFIQFNSVYYMYHAVMQAVEFWNEVSERLQEVISACMEAGPLDKDSSEKEFLLQGEEEAEQLLPKQVHRSLIS